MLSKGCEASGQQLDHSELEIGGGVFDPRFEVLGEASVAAEPGEGALDDPAARKYGEAGGAFGSDHKGLKRLDSFWDGL